MRKFLVAATVAVAVGSLHAQRVLHVPGQYPTINSALSAARSNDTVRVAPGTYRERVVIPIDGITLESSGGPFVTTIDAGGAGIGIQFRYMAAYNVVVQGFTVTNGTVGIEVGAFNGRLVRNCRIFGNRGGRTGGGIDANGSWVTIADNYIANNVATEGGGVYHNDVSGGSLNLHRNEIVGNTATQTGGGVYAPYSLFGGAIYQNVIVGNRASLDGGGAFVEPYVFDFDNNIVAANSAGRHGGGVYAPGYTSSYVTWSHNTVTANTAGVGGGGLALQGSLTIDRSILWGNTAPLGPEALILAPGTYDFDYSIVQGGLLSVTTLAASPWTTINWGPGSITANPRFVDPTNRDYHLSPGSPALNAAPKRVTAFDFEGDRRRGRPDLGADEFTTRLYPVGTARVGQSFALRAVGPTGATVVIALSATRGRRAPQLVLPGITGSFVVPDPFVVLPVGRIPAVGVITLPLTIPRLPVRAPFVAQALVGTRFTNAIDVWIH